MKSVSLADDFALDADELEDVIGCWWSQTEAMIKDLETLENAEPLAFLGRFVVRAWGTNWGTRHGQTPAS